jgi:hypothetical protein
MLTFRVFLFLTPTGMFRALLQSQKTAKFPSDSLPLGQKKNNGYKRQPLKKLPRQTDYTNCFFV